MKKVFTLAILCIVIASANFGSSVKAAGILRINEIMPNPAGLDSKYEWIELLNSGTPTNLKNWKLNGATLPDLPVEEGEIVIIARDLTSFYEQFPTSARAIQFNFSLANTSGEIILEQNGQQNNFSYSESIEGRSIELLTGSCGIISSHASSHSAGNPNSPCPLIYTPSPTTTISPSPMATLTSRVYISKVLASPETGNEWLELTNLEDYPAALDSWSVSDASGKNFELNNIQIPAGGTIQITPQSISLNNDGDHLFLKDHTERVIDIFVYKTSTKGTPLEIMSKGEGDAVEPENTKSGTNVCLAEPKTSTEIKLGIPKFYPLRQAE